MSCPPPVVILVLANTKANQRKTLCWKRSILSSNNRHHWDWAKGITQDTAKI